MQEPRDDGRRTLAAAWEHDSYERCYNFYFDMHELVAWIDEQKDEDGRLPERARCFLSHNKWKKEGSNQADKRLYGHPNATVNRGVITMACQADFTCSVLPNNRTLWAAVIHCSMRLCVTYNRLIVVAMASRWTNVS